MKPQTETLKQVRFSDATLIRRWTGERGRSTIDLLKELSVGMAAPSANGKLARYQNVAIPTPEGEVSRAP